MSSHTLRRESVRRHWVMMFALVLVGSLFLATRAWLSPFVPYTMSSIILDGARNLYEGRGLAGNAINIPFLPYYLSLTPPLTYLWYPAMPIATALMFLVFGMHEWVVLVFPVACYFLTGFAVFMMGRRLFGETAGFLAAVFVLAQPHLIDTSINNNFSDPIMAAALVVSVFAVLVASDAPQTAWRWLLLGGLSLGAAQYARPAGLMLYAPMVVLLLLAFDQRRWTRLALFFGACFGIQLPIFAWYLAGIGSFSFVPTFAPLLLTQAYPGFSALNSLLPTSLFEVVRLHGPDLARKWATQAWVHYKYFFATTSPLVLCAALCAVWAPLSKPQRVIAWFTAVLYASLVVQNSLYVWDSRYLLPVVPFIAVLGSGFLSRAFASLPGGRMIRALVLALIGILAGADTFDFFYQGLKNRRQEIVARDAYAEFATFIRENIRPNEVVMTTDNGLVAWVSGTIAITLANDLATATRIHDDYLAFDALVIRLPLPNAGLVGTSGDWTAVADGRRPFLGFRPEKAVTLSSGETVILLRVAESTAQLSALADTAVAR